MRTVVTNDYYNPPKTAQAVSTLLDAGADVIRSYTDDQGYCEVVKDKGDALAIGEFWTNGEQCGENALVSTVWDFEQYYTDQFEAIQNGEFVSKQLEFLDPATSFRFEDWGPNVPEDVQSQVEQTFDDLVSGAENPFVGPIKDNERQGPGPGRRGADRRVPLRRVGVVRRGHPGRLSSRELEWHAAGRRA